MLTINWYSFELRVYSRNDKSLAFGVGVFGDYLENGKQCYATHTFPERSRKDLSKNVWVVALIANQFWDKRQKHQHRRLNSYRGVEAMQFFGEI